CPITIGPAPMIKILWISVRLGTMGEPRGGLGSIVVRPGDPGSDRTQIGPRSPGSARRRRGPENFPILAPRGASRPGVNPPPTPSSGEILGAPITINRVGCGSTQPYFPVLASSSSTSTIPGRSPGRPGYARVSLKMLYHVILFSQ